MLRAIAIAFVVISALAAQASFEIDPPAPTDVSYVVLQVRDLWRDGCVPLDPKITRADNRIEVLWRLPDGGCPLMVSPWTEDVPLGLLPAGEYEVVLNVDEVIAAVRFVDPAAAPDRSLYERVLVPVLFDGPGAYGSRWATEAEMINASPSSLTFVPDVARPLTSIAPGASASLDGFGNRSGDDPLEQDVGVRVGDEQRHAARHADHAAIAGRRLRRRHGRDRTPRHRPERSARAELARRHPVAEPELLAEIVFRVEPASARDLGDADVAGLEEAGGFLQALFLQELAEQTSRQAVEAAGDVLPRISQLFGHGLDRDFLVGAKSASHRLDQRSQQAVHKLLLDPLNGRHFPRYPS